MCVWPRGTVTQRAAGRASAAAIVVIGPHAWTNHVPIRPTGIDRMTSDRSTPAAALAARILDSQRGFAESGDYYSWDVLAAIAARQPDIVRVERIGLRVATDPAEAGRTVRDPAGHEVLVSVDADPDSFERIFLDALLGRAR